MAKGCEIWSFSIRLELYKTGINFYQHWIFILLFQMYSFPEWTWVFSKFQVIFIRWQMLLICYFINQKKRNDENEHSSKVVCTAMVQEKKYLFLTSSYLQSRWKRFTKNFKRRKSEHCVALNSIKRHDTIVILFWFPRFFRSLIFHPEYFAFAEFYCL